MINLDNNLKQIEFILQNEDGCHLIEFNKTENKLYLLKIDVVEKREIGSVINCKNLKENAQQMLMKLGKSSKPYIIKSFQVVILLFLFYSNLFAQSEYDKGFDKGFQNGYCHNAGISCNPPITPIVPLIRIGEKSDNYQDGYNRGFEMGLNEYKDKTSKSNKSTTERQRYETTDPNFVSDFIHKPPMELIMEVLAKKQSQYELKKLQDKVTIQNKTLKLQREYNNYVKYPDKINDGWHNCIVLDENEIFSKVCAKVEENKITKVFEENFEITFSDSKKIKNGIGRITTKNTDPNYDLDVYFMDYIEDSTTSVDPPIRSYTSQELLDKNMYSTIVIQRPGNFFGITNNPVISINENKITKISNGNTIVIYVFSKDDVTLSLDYTDKAKKWIPDGKGTEYSANIKYGKTYYFKVVPKWQHYIFEKVDNLEVKKLNQQFCEF
jgi:hypothetical protein